MCVAEDENTHSRYVVFCTPPLHVSKGFLNFVGSRVGSMWAERMEKFEYLVGMNEVNT